MIFLKTFETGRVKAAIEGMGYNAAIYRIAWDILAREFGRPEIVVLAQLKGFYSCPFSKMHDTTEVIK